MPLQGRNTQSVTARPTQGGQRQFGVQQAAPPPPDQWDFAGRFQQGINDFGRGLSDFGNNIYQGLQQTPLGQIGAGVGGMFNRASADAQGQGVPEQVEPQHMQAVRSFVLNANLTPDQRRSILQRLENGQFANPEDAQTEAQFYSAQNTGFANTERSIGELGGYQNDAMTRFTGDRDRAANELTGFENSYLGPDSYLSRTEGRLNTIARDPQAMRTDAEYGAILTDIGNQTLSAENQVRRESSQRAAGRGVSGAGGAAASATYGARQSGDLMRADAFRNSLSDVQRRLGDLNSTRTSLAGNIKDQREGNSRYYGGAIDDIGRWSQQYRDQLRSGLTPTPYDFSTQAENRIGGGVYNAGLQREALDRILGLGQNAAALGMQGAGTVMNTIKIPGLTK